MRRAALTVPSFALAVLSFALAVPPAAAGSSRPASARWRGVADLADVPRLAVVAPDLDWVAAEDAWRDAEPGPYRVAVRVDAEATSARDGLWETLADGSSLWRLRLDAPGARSIAPRIVTLELPAAGRVWFYDPERREVARPFGRAQRAPNGALGLPPVTGGEAVLEVWVPRGGRRATRVVIDGLDYGYRGEAKNHGTCNVDFVCPEGDGWRNQGRAVVRMLIQTSGGAGFCTGTLLHNTSGDFTPYVLTANHCQINAENAGTIVFTWNFQAPSCGQRDGGVEAQQQTGSILRAAYEPTDMLLVELAQRPDPSFGVYYAGWDASGNRPQAAVGIHHPRGHVKSISFDHDALAEDTNVLNPNGRMTHWKVNSWNQGTTEPGSSGSCLFDAGNQLCIGDLTGGAAACDNPGGLDVYGKLALSWDEGSSPSTRLRDWLDKAGTGTRQLAGADPGSGPPPGECVQDGDTLCIMGGRFAVEVEWFNQFNNTSGRGGAVPSTDLAGYFYFTDPANIELMFKILDFGNVVKVFYGQLTNLRFTMTIADTRTGQVKRYGNTAGECGAIDQNGFPKATSAVLLDAARGDRAARPGNCVASDTRLCLLDRYAVEVVWTNQFNGQSGPGFATPFAGGLSGSFHYTDPSNVELLAKLLDFGDRKLFIWGALSDLAYRILVTDTDSGATKLYDNPPGRYCGGIDNNAF